MKLGGGLHRTILATTLAMAFPAALATNCGPLWGGGGGRRMHGGAERGRGPQGRSVSGGASRGARGPTVPSRSSSDCGRPVSTAAYTVALASTFLT